MGSTLVWKGSRNLVCFPARHRPKKLSQQFLHHTQSCSVSYTKEFIAQAKAGHERPPTSSFPAGECGPFVKHPPAAFLVKTPPAFPAFESHPASFLLSHVSPPLWVCRQWSDQLLTFSWNFIFQAFVSLWEFFRISELLRSDFYTFLKRFIDGSVKDNFLISPL